MHQDTHKQRKLARTLAMAGHGGDWRRFLLELKEDGCSDAEIAAKLSGSFDIPIDPSTVGEWRRQALAETAERPASGATDRTF